MLEQPQMHLMHFIQCELQEKQEQKNDSWCKWMYERFCEDLLFSLFTVSIIFLMKETVNHLFTKKEQKKMFYFVINYEFDVRCWLLFGNVLIYVCLFRDTSLCNSYASWASIIIILCDWMQIKIWISFDVLLFKTQWYFVFYQYEPLPERTITNEITSKTRFS